QEFSRLVPGGESIPRTGRMAGGPACCTPASVRSLAQLFLNAYLDSDRAGGTVGGVGRAVTVLPIHALHQMPEPHWVDLFLLCHQQRGSFQDGMEGKIGTTAEMFAKR